MFLVVVRLEQLQKLRGVSQLGVYCSTVKEPGPEAIEWMKTPLGTEVDLGPGHIVLDGVPAVRESGTAAPPLFSPMSTVTTVAHLRYC